MHRYIPVVLMKIGILAYDLSTLAGGTNLALTLGRELQKEGYEIAYACVYEDLERLSKKFGQDFGFEIYKVERPLLGRKMLNYNSMLNHSVSIYRMCKDFKPDVIIETGGLICSSLVPVLLKIPTIYYALETSHNYSKRNLLSRTYFAPLKPIEGVIAKKVTVCAISDTTAKIVQRMWNVNAKVIFPPVDTETFKPGNKKENIILCVLRFLPIYDFEKLIATFKSLRNDKYSLVLMGGLAKESEKYFKYLKEITESDSNITLLPNEDFKVLLEFYKKSRFFWYPTGAYYGIVIAEAQSAGLPTISFGADSGPGEIIINGKTGYLVNSFGKMAKKTKMLINDKKHWTSMSDAARKNALSRLGTEIFSKKFKEVIGSVRR